MDWTNWLAIVHSNWIAPECWTNLHGFGDGLWRERVLSGQRRADSCGPEWSGQTDELLTSQLIWVQPGQTGTHVWQANWFVEGSDAHWSRRRLATDDQLNNIFNHLKSPATTQWNPPMRTGERERNRTQLQGWSENHFRIMQENGRTIEGEERTGGRTGTSLIQAWEALFRAFGPPNRHAPPKWLKINKEPNKIKDCQIEMKIMSKTRQTDWRPTIE